MNDFGFSNDALYGLATLGKFEFINVKNVLPTLYYLPEMIHTTRIRHIWEILDFKVFVKSKKQSGIVGILLIVPQVIKEFQIG